MFWDLRASGVGSKVWVLTIRVLQVNPELDSIHAQRGRARSALFSRVVIIILFSLNIHSGNTIQIQNNQEMFLLIQDLYPAQFEKLGLQLVLVLSA